MKYWVGLLLTACLASCGNDQTTTPANASVYNDFESLAGWIPPEALASLSKEKAHSGLYSVAVRPGIEYSLGYSNTLGQMSETRPRHLKLSAWVFVPAAQLASAQLIAELTNPRPPAAGTLVKQTVDFKKEITKFGAWQHVEKVIDIPPTATANSVFKLYLWRAGSGQPVYLDDVALSLDNAAD